jgi:hypothetical protein
MQAPYFNVAAGYWFDGQGQWTLQGTPMGGGFGRCVGDFCLSGVRVLFGDRETGIAIDRGVSADEAAIHGSTLKQLKASFVNHYPDATFDSIAVDGQPALTASSREARVVIALALNHGRLYGLLGFTFVPGLAIAEIQAFLPRFHFMPASCWMQPCRDEGWWARPELLVAFDPNAGNDTNRGNDTWRDAGSRWSSGPGPGDRSARGFWLGGCADNLCSGYVTVALGSASTGAVVDGWIAADAWNWARTSGSTLDEVVDSVSKQLDVVMVERIKVDGVSARRVGLAGRQLVLLIHRGHVLAITAFDGFLRSNAGETMTAFLDGLDLLD